MNELIQSFLLKSTKKFDKMLFRKKQKHSTSKSIKSENEIDSNQIKTIHASFILNGFRKKIK